jgi:glycosyl transferase, family 25
MRLADGVLVINLDERPDRWRDALKELAPYLDIWQPHRLPAIKGVALNGFGRPPLFRGRRRDKTWAGRAGCVLSHRQAIAHAAGMGWRSVLILEDDIHLGEDFAQVSEKLAEVLEFQSWDICYLGFTDPVGPFLSLSDLGLGHRLYRVYGCSTTHAYLVRDSAYASLLRRLPDDDDIWFWLTRNRALDRWYRRTLSRYFRVLAISPSIVYQKQGVSDITGRNQEYGHIAAVPANALSILPFDAARLLRSRGFSILNAYDRARGSFKRWNGF